MAIKMDINKTQRTLDECSNLWKTVKSIFENLFCQIFSEFKVGQ